VASSWPDARGAETLVKVCGVRSVTDARMCVGLGVHALGLNFWPGSRRRVAVDVAAEIVQAVGEEVATVGLFVDEAPGKIAAIREQVGLSWVQLHGGETPEVLESLGPRAYKAIRVGADGGALEAEAMRYGGDLLLLDTFVAGEVGGTGLRFDWQLATDLAKRRPIVLAGGLDAQNVAEAIRVVRPRAVDVASGVESKMGDKDESRVAAFVAAVRGAV
jgi:phosphoribosylanthranilate isomerase